MRASALQGCLLPSSPNKYVRRGLTARVLGRMNIMVYESIVVGGGPAAVSAAINLKILNKKFLWLGAASSKKAASAELVRNYPGLPEVTGKQLVWTFENHADRMGVARTEGLVTAIYDLGGRFAVVAGTETYECLTVILCTGVAAQKPIEGEEQFLGRGVSYCATCDGFLYKGKNIAVLLFDKMFEHEAEYLASLAAKVYVMPMYRGCAVSAQNAEIMVKMPRAIAGGMKAEKLVFADGELAVDGIFILRSSVSPSVLLHGLASDGGHIVADRQCRTNIAGVFAAGDCTGRPYQYAKAVGEGNVAAHSAVEYLAQIKK